MSSKPLLLIEQLQGQVTELLLEVERLKQVVAAKPPEDGKSLRVEMNTTPAGKPCLIVTAPIHFDEQRLADTIAGILNVWWSIAEDLSQQKKGPTP